MRQVLTILLLSVVLFAVQSCFTGIESTPKITASDVKKEKVVITPEQMFLDSVGNEPFGQWSIGKKFYVTDNKINLIFGASAQNGEALEGKSLSYKGMRKVVSVAGEEETELIFASDSGTEYCYRVAASLADLLARKDVEVPFTIEMSLVDAVRDKLMGQSYYLITSVWYDMNDEIAYGRKFIPVKIVGVEPGNHVYPIKLTFVDSAGKQARLFLSVGNGYKSPRSFATLFSFTDPKMRYPDIKADVWDNIIHGRVALDMTRSECRLSLGAPTTVDTRPGYSGVRELWVYENGAYLVFEDGLLRDYRNVNIKRQ